MKYTIKNFKNDFPDNDACLNYVFNQKYGDQFVCPKCKREGMFKRVKKRKCYACPCGHQVHPCGNTIFHKSRTPLILWFYVIFLMSKSKNGISAKKLQRHTRTTFKTSYRQGQQIRKLMTKEPPTCKITKRFKSQFERSIKATYHSVSKIQAYWDEFVFRYNHRQSPQHIFHILTKRI